MDAARQESSALERLIREGSDADIQRFFLLLRPPELADVLERIPDQDRTRVVRLMGAPLASEVLREVEEGEREEILEGLSEKRIAAILRESFSDDAVDMIASLDPEIAERALRELEPEDRAELRALLTYPEDTAGGIMQTEVVKVPSDLTVKDALAVIRDAHPDHFGDIHEVFVVDAEDRLIGTASPAELIYAEPHANLRVVVEPDPVSVPVTMDQEQIAGLAREHDLASIPVVDSDGRLVGQILHDDLADVIAEEATEDIAQMAGVDPEEMYADSVAVAVRSRAPWLLPAFAGGLFVTFFLSSVEEEIAKAAYLAAFLPIVLGMAGNVGTQTSAITVRSLALGRIEFEKVWRVIARQFLTGLSLGLMFGLMLAAVALVLQADTAGVARVSLTLGIAICMAMTVGATMGCAVPILLHKVGFDPAMGTSPFVQTANDLTGASIVFLIANWLGLFH